MSYIKTDWVDNATPLNAINLNNIEAGISDNEANIIAHQALTTAHGAVSASTASKIALRDASGNLVAKQLKSDIAQGTAPLTVISTTVVPNLNADMVGGLHSTDLAKTAQEAWITPTLLNAWVNFAPTSVACQYMKDSMGFVHLRGLVKSGGINTVIYTLPLGYRPSEMMHFGTTSNNAYGQVEVYADGSVIVDIGNNTFVSLNVPPFLAI